MPQPLKEMPKSTKTMPKPVAKGGKPLATKSATTPPKNGTNGNASKKSKSKPTTVERVERPVIYPHHGVMYCFDGEIELFPSGVIPSIRGEPVEGATEFFLTETDKGEVVKVKGVGPLTVEAAKKLLGWETESEYTARILLSNPDTPPEKAVFKDFHLNDLNGEHVMCWNNVDNRLLRMNDCLMRCQDILTKKWRFNCETIIIGKTGKIVSGQHRLIGLILASQKWDGDDADKWHAIWTEEPTMETLIAFGCSEDEDVIRTIDNVAPRSESDIIYTDPIFADLESAQRKECSRIMAKATDILWRRTRAMDSPINKLQTHSVSIEWIHNHPKLKEIVLSMFKLNKERTLSITGIQASEATALCYLFAASAADGEKYRSKIPRSESILNKSFNHDVPDWDGGNSYLWEMAHDFFTKLSESNSSFSAIKDVKRPRDGDTTEQTGKVFSDSGTTSEKIGVIIRAWQAFLANPGQDLDVESLSLSYRCSPADYGPDNPIEKVELIENPVIGGIDMGELKKHKPTDKEIEEEDDPDAAMEAVEDEKIDARQKVSERAFEKVKQAKAAKAISKGAVATAGKELKGGTGSTPIRLDDPIEDEEDSDADVGVLFDAAWHKYTNGNEGPLYYKCREDYMALVAIAVDGGEDLPDADAFVVDEAPSQVKKPVKVGKK